LTHAELRRWLGLVWMIGVGAALYLAFFHRDLIVSKLRAASDVSLVAGGAVYLALGCLRGFTLIPVTSLLLIGILFFPPVPLFVLTLAGLLVSSTSIYYFSEALHLEEVFARQAVRMNRLRDLLNRRGFPIIAVWSFLPFAPTDLVCYLSGVLRIRFWVMLAGVALGEGLICAIYIVIGSRVIAS
jgi:uncharacterized membrane protein YdjX (TVP38/TMEM64 family)